MSCNSKNEPRQSNQQTHIDEYVKQIVDAAPEIDAATRAQLALLLRDSRKPA